MVSFKRNFAPDGSSRSKECVLPTTLPSSAVGKFLAQMAAVFAAVAMLQMGTASAQSVAAGANLWAAFDAVTNPTGKGCSGCHGTPPDILRRNAANAASVITSAITNNAGLAMGAFATLTLTEKQSLALYIGSTISGSQSASVAYNSSVTITLNDIATTSSLPASTVINGISTVGPTVGGTLGAYSLMAPSVIYTHTANNCSNGSFIFQGTGSATPQSSTSQRTVTILITAPTPPTVTGSTATIAYNSVTPTNIPLSLGGGAATSLIVGALSGGAGTVSASGTTLAYTASSTTYAASQTFTVQAIGPCATSAPATITLNVGPPPAPTVTAPAGPFQTPFNTAAAPVNLSASISGISSSITVTSVNNGTTTVSGNSVTFTPTTNFTGTGSFTYRANGPGGPSTTSSAVNITVLPAPPSVTAAPGPFSTAFNTPINIDLSGRVTGTFTSIATTGVTNGTTTVAGNVVTFTPAVAFFGTGSFQFTATNAGGTSPPSAAMNITVLPPPPVVAARSVLVTFQLPLPIDLSAQITGVSSSIAVVTPAVNGSTSVTGNVVTYTPNALFTGADSFMYQANGPGGVSNSAQVSINVVAPAPPTATAPPPVTTAFNTQTAIDVSAQVGGVFTNVAVVTVPTNGTIVSIVGNIITYRPNAGFVGADGFSFRAQGPGGTISTPPANVSITVLPAVPIVTAPAIVTTALNTPVAINLAAQISGVFSSIAISAAPTNGNATVAGTTVTYTPNTGYTGADSFKYTATGTGGISLPSPPVNINILPAAPVVTARSVAVAFATPVAIDLSAQISGNVTSIAVVSPPSNGTIASVIGKVVTYLPNGGFAGADSFTYRATGPGGSSGVATVTISVTSAPAPTVINGTAAVVFNTPKVIDLTTQISGLFSSIAVATSPANGTIVSVVGNVVTYAPRSGYVGGDSFSFTATGPGGTSAPATLALTVAAPPAPTVSDSAVTVLFNTTSTINLSSQINGVTTAISIVSLPAHGSISVAGNIVSFTPVPGYFGDDSFTYTASGPGGTSAPASVAITVGIQAPTAGSFKMIVPLNTSTTMDLAPFITGSAVSGIVVITAPKHGSAAVNGTKLTFTPLHNYFGVDSFSYAVFGNAGTSPSAVVTVAIVGRPDPTQDAAVTGLVAAQADAAKRFARTQISNFQSRMESLHRIETTVPLPASARGAGGVDDRVQVAAKTMPKDGASLRNQGKITTEENAYLSASYASAPVMPETWAAAQKPLSFLNDAVSLITSGSINLASVAGANVGAVGGATGNSRTFLPSLWLAGSANFGTRAATGRRTGLDFTTAGVSMGADQRFGDQWVMGAGLGFARDRTDIGSEGSYSRARAFSVVGYGSYQPSARTFVDSLIGIGSINFKSQRMVTAINDIASGERRGRQVFGSLAAGIEYRDNGVLISPYARLDYSSDRLNQNTEMGASQYALTYFQQTTPSVQGAIGVRAESVHNTNFGWAAPRLRAEYRHDFQGERQTSIGYADSIGGRFGLTTGAVSRNTLVLGIGSEFIYRGGWTLGVDYQVEHSTSFSGDSSQGIKFTITKDLDARESPYSLIAAAISPQKPIDIQVDAGIMFDSNVTRAKESAEKLSDRIYSVNASRSKIFPINENLRAILTGSVGGEKFSRYYKLSRATAGIQGELVYRPSADFDAPTFSVFAQSSAEQYESRLRDGYRYSAGVSIRKPLTDRIALFGALSHHERYTKSAVFNNRFNAARMNVDYTLSATETIYLSGEYRRGQIVSTGLSSLENLEVADVFVQDDAYGGGQLFSYRFFGNTVLSTLGYNLGLGPRHSLDLSWQRAQSTPRFRPGFATSPSSYIADQYSLVYLIRF